MHFNRKLATEKELPLVANSGMIAIILIKILKVSDKIDSIIIKIKFLHD